MTAVDRLAKRLLERNFVSTTTEGREVAGFIYEDYLPSQIIGMKEAAERIGLATSNTLDMRLARGHDIDLAVQIPGGRITTKDAIDAYAEVHPPQPRVRDDDIQQAPSVERNREVLRAAREAS